MLWITILPWSIVSHDAIISEWSATVCVLVLVDAKAYKDDLMALMIFLVKVYKSLLPFLVLSV